MQPKQRELITKRLQYFQHDFRPTELLPRLTCLTEADSQQVECDENNKGATRATWTLIDKLKRRENGFEQFVLAVRCEGLGHIALLLDHSFEVSDEDILHEKEDTRRFYKIGSAVDIRITGRITKKDLPDRQLDIEKLVAEKFAKLRSEDTKEIRKEFNKVLPRGIEFVQTKQMGGPLSPRGSRHEEAKPEIELEPETEELSQKLNDVVLASEHAGSESESEKPSADQYMKDSVVAVFRFATIAAVDEFKGIWENGKFQEICQELLVTRPLSNMGEKKDRLPLELMMNFLEEDMERIKNILEDVEAEQEVERTGDDLLRSARGSDGHETDFLDEQDISINIPPVYLESNHGSALAHDLKLRKYQEELAEPAIQGYNTVICAPTNSGKTFVAMEIAKQHLDKHSDHAKGAVEIPDQITGPKVIFIVSTQNLVLQQRQRFEAYLSNYAVCDISGVNSTEIPLKFLLKANDVVVLTAQILLNALQNKNELSSISLSDLSLLIFDECHHTNKNHSYNKIMHQYIDLKLKKHKGLPQVVGLTASLGVGKSNTVENAHKHILQICANMDAQKINTVRENVNELKDCVTGGVPERKVIRVNTSQSLSPFTRACNQVMDKIEKAAKKSLPDLQQPPCNRVSQQYRQWIEVISKQACALGLRQLTTYIEQLRQYHLALLTNDTVRMKDALTCLKEYFDTLDETKFTENDKLLHNLYHKAKELVENHVAIHGETPNPKLEELKKLLLGFHENDSRESKGILFTVTRGSTVGLVEWIKESEDLKHKFRPKALVGGGDGVVGMSQQEQELIIEEFKKGVVNILIATSVAEEGLDIKDCSFVIRYDTYGNEISSTQARGRIRADQGQYVYLADARSKGHEREKLNQYREILMTDAVAAVQKLTQDEYMKEIDQLQQKDARIRQIKSQLEARKRDVNQHTATARFYCRKCNTFACEARDFRCVSGSHYVVISPEFKRDKIELKPHKKPKLIDGITMDTKVHCKKCGEDWGVTAKIHGAEWPLLKINSFVVQIEGGPRKLYRKWTEAALNIKQVDDYLEVLAEEEAGLNDSLMDDLSLDDDL
ncbi:antiviral innate immune response receptor RIG-I isoform X2 [Nematostella vectensis]|uniref:antiviral innate immune response receptor RIG-I isoform X2 n=1 Tax=Nematostella vectensis TaxID=45351 RepID=UPI0020775491|nr:antiviral innate immune response receptor RIG-I isoform X2 [Nematostella vectensis]